MKVLRMCNCYNIWMYHSHFWWCKNQHEHKLSEMGAIKYKHLNIHFFSINILTQKLIWQKERLKCCK